MYEIAAMMGTAAVVCFILVKMHRSLTRSSAVLESIDSRLQEKPELESTSNNSSELSKDYEQRLERLELRMDSFKEEALRHLRKGSQRLARAREIEGIDGPDEELEDVSTEALQIGANAVGTQPETPAVPGTVTLEEVLSKMPRSE